MIPTLDTAFTATSSTSLDTLGHCARGWRGWVSGFAPSDTLTIPWHEMERRLLEMGFVEGARIELLQEGPIGRDPIAVRVDDLTVALRRRDADVILVSEG
jgi:ferrous iron transport protein A